MTDLLLPSPFYVTPLNVDAWISHLDLFPHADKDWLLNGLIFGFKLEIQCAVVVSAESNCRSAKVHGDVINNYLKEEINMGSIAGPFSNPPILDLHINRFGVIPKSTPGKWRLITDLSFPIDGSVNTFIPDSKASVSYEGIPEAISKMVKLGPGALMAKFDIKRAYRLLPVNDQDRKYLGMKWDGKFYVDLALPFGLRSAPQIFTRFADILQTLFERTGPVRYIQHYLDDFFIVGEPKSNECQVALNNCFRVCQSLGVPLAEDKTEGPSTCITFLGFELDSLAMELRLPAIKLEKIKAKLKLWESRRSGTKRKLLSLIGSLQHCCQAIVLGRPFLRRLIDRAYSVSELHHFVHLSAWEKEDLDWWNTLLQEWNGRSLFLFPKWEKAPDMFVTSDAAGSIGFGAFYNDESFAERWPAEAAPLNIAIKEMIPIVVAANLWGNGWQRKRIAFKSDNMAVVFCLRNGTCNEKHLAFLLRELSLLAVKNNFTFTAIHIPGRENRKADALSRFNFQAFHKDAPLTKIQSVPRDLLVRLISLP